MAKSREKIRALALRKKGHSIKRIARFVKVSTSTVSIWCREVNLTQKQRSILRSAQIRAGHKGRLLGAEMQKMRRLNLIIHLEKEARSVIGNLTQRDLLFAGIGLYAGEGFQSGNKAGFTNSNPHIIALMIRWFRVICKVQSCDFVCTIGINAAHYYRAKRVQDHWVKVTGISKRQFKKLSLKKVVQKKLYENPENHFGTLTIKIRKSSVLQYRIQGWIKALLR